MKQFFRTAKFGEIFKNENEFTTAFGSTAFAGVISSQSLSVLYALLDAKYGNSRIANSDEEQFKKKLFAVIWQYAPAWEKKLAVQKTLRELTETDIITGAKQINDHAFNPNTIINTTTGEIDTVNEQTKSRYVKSKLDGYSLLLELLRNDVTEEFMGKFRRLFYIVIETEYPSMEE